MELNFDKKPYVKAELDIVEVSTTDIICTSPGGTEPYGDGGNLFS